MITTRSTLLRLAYATTIVLVLALANASCNRVRILHGYRFSSDGTTLLIASRLPSCGCITLAKTERRDKTEDEMPLVLVSHLFGEERGQYVLEKNQPVRVRFDWAGPQSGNAYRITAHFPKVDNAGKIIEPIQPRDEGVAPLQDYLYVDPTSVVESSCSEQVCSFQTLGMNRAFTAQLGQNEVEQRRRGVNLTRGGQALELSARASDPRAGFDESYHCGCVTLRNTSAGVDVELQAMLHGREIGRLTLPYREGANPGQRLVAFDAAGSLGDDVYVITALAVTPASQDETVAASTGQSSSSPPRTQTGVDQGVQQGGTPGPAPKMLSVPPETTAARTAPRPGIAPVSESALVLADYVTVIGFIDSVRCTPQGTAFPVPGQLIAQSVKEYFGEIAAGRPAGTKAFAPDPQIFQVECTFGSLNMNQVQRTKKPEGPGPGTPKAGTESQRSQP